MTCTSDATTTMEVEFRDETSGSFSSDAPATGEASFQVYLESLLSVGQVNVTYSSGATLCTTDGSNDATVTFLTELGDLPNLLVRQTSSGTATVSVSVDENVKGSKEAHECSDMGTCDRTTGLCSCFAGFTSSNADGAWGTRGDCGFADVFVKKKGKQA